MSNLDILVWSPYCAGGQCWTGGGHWSGPAVVHYIHYSSVHYNCVQYSVEYLTLPEIDSFSKMISPTVTVNPDRPSWRVTVWVYRHPLGVTVWVYRHCW